MFSAVLPRDLEYSPALSPNQSPESLNHSPASSITVPAKTMGMFTPVVINCKTAVEIGTLQLARYYNIIAYILPCNSLDIGL